MSEVVQPREERVKEALRFLNIIDKTPLAPPQDVRHWALKARAALAVDTEPEGNDGG